MLTAPLFHFIRVNIYLARVSVNIRTFAMIYLIFKRTAMQVFRFFTIINLKLTNFEPATVTIDP